MSRSISFSGRLRPRGALHRARSPGAGDPRTARASALARLAGVLGVVAVCLLMTGAVAAAPGQDKDERPEIRLRVTPPMGVAPLRIVATAELSGGADDYADFYCPKVSWEWADGARSESTDDCSPYEAGKSEIRRRFTRQHTYREPGVYQIEFSLKQGTKTVGYASLKLEVHGG